MGVIDVFVFAHNHHRRNVDNPGNFEDCMEGRVRFLTTIAPAYAHAHQSICFAGRLLVVPHQKFRLPAAKAWYPHLPNSRTTTRERGNDFQGWAVYTDGVLALPMVKPWLDGVLSHNLATEEYIYIYIYICCLAQMSQPKHISRTQEPESIPTVQLNCRPWSKRFLFLGPLAWLVARDAHSCVFYQACGR